jgi:hypothetical protein
MAKALNYRPINVPGNIDPAIRACLRDMDYAIQRMIPDQQDAIGDMIAADDDAFWVTGAITTAANGLYYRLGCYNVTISSVVQVFPTYSNGTYNLWFDGAHSTEYWWVIAADSPGYLGANYYKKVMSTRKDASGTYAAVNSVSGSPVVRTIVATKINWILASMRAAGINATA